MAGGGLYNPSEGVTTFAALTDTQVVRKTADETVNNSVALQDDDELFFAVEVNEVWEFTSYLILTTVTNVPELKSKWVIPAGGVCTSTEYHRRVAGPLIDDTAEYVTDLDAGITEAKLEQHLYVGGANAGDVQLQWAQNAAVAEDTKILTNSYIIAHRLA